VVRGPTSALLALLAIAALAGCGDSSEGSERGTAKMIDWDLRQRPTLEDVDWPKPDVTSVELKPVESVRIALPEGRTFAARDGIDAVYLDREDKLVTSVAVHSKPLDTDAAFELARDWASEFGLPPEPLERWRRERKAGELDATAKVLTKGEPGDTVGDDGPAPSVQIGSSTNEQRPSYVALQLFWQPPRP
jgi:hypothetical protein